jgi:hypothetical protein
MQLIPRVALGEVVTTWPDSVDDVQCKCLVAYFDTGKDMVYDVQDFTVHQQLLIGPDATPME